MRAVSIQELHRNTSEFVREAADGEVIVIERRGEPVAELRPILKQTSKKRLPDMREFGVACPPRRPTAADSSKEIASVRQPSKLPTHPAACS